MPKYVNQIEYNITTKLDSQGLTQLQTQIREIENSLQQLASKNLNDPFHFGDSAQELEKLNKALSSSFNSSLGILDLSKLKTELKDAGVSAKSLGKAFADGGAQGKIAFNNFLGQIGKLDTGLKRTSTTLDKMFNTISNTVRWGIVSSGFSAILNSLHQSIDYVKELDNSMTQIMLVTDYSRQQMNEYAKSANEAAKALGNTTVGVMEGTQVFAQQGYNLEQSGQLAELSIKLANASEQEASVTSDQITALMNAYGISGDMEKLSKALDSWALVANISAADVEELAKASQKAASSAATMGVGLDQMNAQIATIESVTREAPEQIGNGLKTLYGRLSDISLGETLEDGVDLGQVTGTLDKIGVQVLDQAGKMRNVGDIMEDLMSVWENLDQTAKEAAGQAIAGKYQLNRFYALMDNSEMYNEYKAGSEQAEGTLDQMNEERLNSWEGKVAKLQATLEGFFNSIFKPDNFYPAMDALTGFIDLINKLVDSIGGGGTVLTGAIALFTRLFSNNMAQMINDASYNRQVNELRQSNSQVAPEMMERFKVENEEDLTPEQKKVIENAQYFHDMNNRGVLSKEQAEDANKFMEDNINALDRYMDAMDKASKAGRELDLVLAGLNEEFSKAFFDEDKQEWDYFAALEELQDFDKTKLSKVKETMRSNIKGGMQDLGSNLEDVVSTGEEWLKTQSTDVKTLDELYVTLSDGIGKARDNLEALKLAFTPEDYEKIAKAIDMAEEQYKELGNSGEDAGEKVKQAALIINDVKEALSQGIKDLDSPEGADRATRRIINMSTNARAAKSDYEGTERQVKGYEDLINKQLDTKSIIEVTSAVGELAFAWQGFQNLGSLWRNSDMSTGEKILQTIINISMTLPSLINSLKTLQGSGEIISGFFSKVGSKAKDFVGGVADRANPIEWGKKVVEGEHQEVLEENQKTIEEYKAKIAQQQEEVRKIQEEKRKLEEEIKKLEEDKRPYDEIIQEQEEKIKIAEEKYNETGDKHWKNVISGHKSYITKQKNKKAPIEEEIAEKAEKIKDFNKTQEEAVKNMGELKGASIEAVKSLPPKPENLTTLNLFKAGLSAIGKELMAITIENPFFWITAVTAGIGLLQGHLDDLRETANKTFDEMNEKYTDVTSQIDNYNQLYETWKETGQGADALSEAGTELSDTLNILGGDALVASEKFEKLKEKIDAAAQSDYQDVISAAQEAMTKNENYGFLNTSSITNDIFTGLNKVWDWNDPWDPLRQLTTKTMNPATGQPISSFKEGTEDPATAIGTLTQAMDILKEKQKEVQVGSEEYNKLQEKWNELNAIYMNENIQKWLEASKAMAEATGKTEEFKNKLTSVGTDANKALELFSEEYGTNNYFKTLSTDAEKFDFILQQLDEDNAALRDSVQVAQLESGLKEQAPSLDFSSLDGFSDKFKIQVLTELDPDSKTSLQQQLNELVNDNNAPKIQLQLDVNEVRQQYSDVWQAMLNDETVGKEQLNDVFDDNINKIFTDVSDLSDAFKDAFTLLTDGTYRTQASMAELRGTLDDVEHSVQMMDIEETTGKISDLEDKVYELSMQEEALKRASEGSSEEINSMEEVLRQSANAIDNTDDNVHSLLNDLDQIDDLETQIEVNSEDLAEAKEELNDLKDTLEDQSFKLSVDIGGDLIDQADALTEALGDISAGTDMIGEGFLVAADDAKALENAFPGILENYTVTTDGMIQLDQERAASAVGVATADSESFAQAQVSKLLSYAEYADAMSQRYMEEAVLMAEKASHEEQMEADVNADIANSEKELADYNVGLMKDKDLAASNAAMNEILYGQQAGNEIGSAMEQGADHAAKALSSLSYESAGAAQKVIEQWADAAEQVKASGEGNNLKLDVSQHGYDTRGVQPEGPITVDSNVRQYKEIFIGDSEKPYQVLQNNPDAQKYAGKAVEFQAKAEAYQRMAGQARASAASLEATQMTAGNDIANIGQPKAPKEEKAPKESTPKESTPKEDKEETEKVYEPKLKDPIEEEIDLYEKVNTQLDDVQTNLTRIQKETDRLVGPSARANMNKQIGLLEKEIDLLGEKLEIQEQERIDLQFELLARWNVEFDEEGFINNYADVLKGLEQRVNDLTSEYNNATTEEEQDNLSLAIENAEAEVDAFKKVYQRYDELQGKEIQDTINQIEELKDSIEDLRIEAYTAAQEAIDNLKELNDTWAELKGLFTDYKSDSPFRKTIEDAEKLKNIFGGTKEEAIEYYQQIINKNIKELGETDDPAKQAALESNIRFFTEQQAYVESDQTMVGTGALGLAEQDLVRLQKWVENPTAEDNPFGEDTAALYEAYRDAYDRTAELALESEKAWEQLEEDIIDGYDDIADREEEQIDRYDRITDHLERIGDMTTLAFGDTAYDKMSKIYNQVAQTTMQQARDQKVIYQNWVDRYNAIEDKTSDIAKTVLEHMEEAEAKLEELQKKAAEGFKEAFENAIKEVTAKMNKNVFGVRNLDDVSSDWERDRDYAQKYYDDVQKANLIEQLRLKYMDLLDDAQNSSLDIQNRIRDSMNEQIKYLQDQNHLSEFNVKYANAQLEILQKQIALEDARANKNQMRLRRDTQGNYRYVYSADQTDVRQKEQDLLQSEFDAYNMSNDNRMNTYDEALAYYQRFIEQRELLEQRVAQGDEEAAAALEKLLADYNRDMLAYSEELSDSWQGMVVSLQWMAETGSDAVKESAETAMKAIEEKTDESLGAVGIQWSGTIDGAVSNVQRLLQETRSSTEEMTQLATDYYDTINNSATGVASLVDEGFSNLDDALIGARNETQDLAAATRVLNAALAGDNAALVEATQRLEDYRQQLEGVKDASSVTANRLKETRAQLSQAEAQNLNYRTVIDEKDKQIDYWKNYTPPAPEPEPEPEPVYTDSGGGGGDNTIRGYSFDDLVEGIAGNIWTYGETSWGNDPTRHAYMREKFGQETGDAIYGAVQNLFNNGYGYGYEPPRWASGGFAAYHEFDVNRFDTGGYTGDWNSSEGRIAMLHEKELVLNASDTQNILLAVGMVRAMADSMKTITGIGNALNNNYTKLGGDTIEQRVEITADFPNVQSSNEIENALLNLADSAYQYSYRTR